MILLLNTKLIFWKVNPILDKVYVFPNNQSSICVAATAIFIGHDQFEHALNWSHACMCLQTHNAGVLFILLN